MVLISIDPFSFKKTFLLVIALLGLSSALCLADPVFISSQYVLAGRQSHRVEAASVPPAVQSDTWTSALVPEADFVFATVCNPD